MNRLLLLPFKSVTLPGVALGLAGGYLAKKFARPLIVETLRLGYEVKDGTVRMMDDARRAASEVATEARVEKKKA